MLLSRLVEYLLLDLEMMKLLGERVEDLEVLAGRTRVVLRIPEYLEVELLDELLHLPYVVLGVYRLFRLQQANKQRLL